MSYSSNTALFGSGHYLQYQHAVGSCDEMGGCGPCLLPSNTPCCGCEGGVASGPCLKRARWWPRRRGGQWALPATCHAMVHGCEVGETSGPCLQSTMWHVVAGKTVALPATCHVWWLLRREVSGPCLQHIMSWLMAATTGRPMGLACNIPCHGSWLRRWGGQWVLPTACHVMAATTGRPVGLAHNMPCHGCDDGEASGPCQQHAMPWLRSWGWVPVGYVCNTPCAS